MSKAGSKAEKQNKKRRKGSKGSKGDDDDGDKNCDDCAADPTEEDPVRQLAIQKQKHEIESGVEHDTILKPMLIHWGKPRKYVDGKMIAPGKRCYYCNRTRRSKAAYRKLKKKEWKEFMDDEENKEQFQKDRAVTVLTLHNRGMDCRIGEADYNNSTFVSMV